MVGLIVEDDDVVVCLRKTLSGTASEKLSNKNCNKGLISFAYSGLVLSQREK